MCALWIAPLAAQTVMNDPPFRPAFADSRAVGDVGVASAGDFQSLYLNPAGFAAKNATITLTKVSAGLDFLPTGDNLRLAGEAWNDPANSGAILSPLGASVGFGGNGAFGIGYAGAGLGLGLIASVDGFAPSIDGSLADASALATVAFIGGLGFTVGNHLTVGGAVRPMVRVNVPTAGVGDLLSFAAGQGSSGSNVPSLYGIGVGVDLGARYSNGPLSYGLALRDVAGTRMYYEGESLGTLESSIASGNGVPQGGSTGNVEYVIPMSLTLGVAFHPNLGAIARYFDPQMEVDYLYTFDPSRPIWSQTVGDFVSGGLHAGIDARVLSYVHLRAGYELGDAFFGLGFQLPVVSIDATAFSRVIASDSGGPRQGMTVSFTLHL